MPSRPDLREIASNVKDAFADADRDTLLDVLTFVVKEYVVEGPPPMLIHQAETLSDLRAPSFAHLITALQTRFDHPELAMFVEVAKGGGGSVTPGELESYLGLVYGLPAGHLFRNAIPLNAFHYFVTSAGADVESASPGAVAAAVHSFLNPDVRQVQAVNNQFGGKPKTPKKTKTKQHKLSKSQISVLVLNAGRVAGQAENTSYRLATHGYTTRTLPASPNAHATNVANAVPTRMSLAERGAPPGRSKPTWIVVVWW